MSEFTTSSREQTAALGRSFAGVLAPGDVVAVTGTLGSGKTQFISGVCGGLGVHTHVGSPTFTLIHEYPAPFGTVVHIDLYRIESRRELAELGIEEYFSPHHICLIEWAEKALEFLPPGHRTVRLSHGNGEEERIIVVDDAEGMQS
jgi:tRNA threonylcarbamoyladenosine biosynthesis protein TsaE